MHKQDDLHNLLNQLHTLNEHIAEGEVAVAEARKGLARNRTDVFQGRSERLQEKWHQIHVLEHTTPAMNAHEDRRRRKSASLRSLTGIELQILSLRGSWLFQVFMIVIVSRILPRLVRERANRIKELRRQAQRDWEQQLSLFRRELSNLERDVYLQKDTDFQQYTERGVSMREKEIRDLKLKHDLLQQKIKEHEFTRYFQEELANIPDQVFLPKSS